MRRTLAVAVCAAAFASGCGGSSKQQQQVLRVGTVGQSLTLNPFAGLQGDYAAFQNIYPSLAMTRLPTLAFEPYLATGWKASPDGLTWTFQIRPHAHWSDGQPLTAQDAAWTISTILKDRMGATANYAEYVTHLASATAPNATTVVLRYQAPVANVLAEAGSVAILPRHIWAKAAAGNGSGLASFVNAPSPGHPVVSGGPFMVTQQQRNAIELFQRNPRYWGQPSLAGFGIKYYANADAMTTALKNGEIDVATSVPPTAVQSLRSAGLVVADAPSINFDDLAINTTAGKVSHRELLDPRVRHALDLAIDRRRIGELVYLGHAAPGSVIDPPALSRWHAPIAPTPFDVTEANRLLDTAGYKRGPGGTRLANGQPMSYKVLLAPTADRELAIIAAGFARIGVRLSSQPVDSKAHFAALSANKYRNFDLSLGSGTAGGLDPDFGLSAFTCMALGLYNKSGYCNPAYDKLYQAQGISPQRVAVVAQLQRMIYDERPIAVLTYPDILDAWSSHWTGFVESPAGIYNYLVPYSLTGVHRTG
jgi:peptide/nickel transport system substrate-binding protein